MIHVKPTDNGGRTITIHVPYLDFEATVNPDNTLEVHLCNIPPEKPSIVQKIAGAGKSIIKTKILRKDRTTDKEFGERLTICKNCPSNLVILNKRGDPHQCGKLLDSFKSTNKTGCGCFLREKARDRKQTCPQGHWPNLTDK